MVRNFSARISSLKGMMAACILSLSLNACSSLANKPESGTVHISPSDMSASFQLSSPAFKEGEWIPSQFGCEGEDINPELLIQSVPVGTKSFALIVEDPDAPNGLWVHWLVWNIPASTLRIPQNSIPGTEGMNDFRKLHYGGPCPPSGIHRYYFRLYALNANLELKAGATRAELLKAMSGKETGTAVLMGRYKRK